MPELDETSLAIGRLNAVAARMELVADRWEERLRDVEKNQWFFAGAAAVAGVVGSYLLQHWKNILPALAILAVVSCVPIEDGPLPQDVEQCAQDPSLPWCP